MVKRSRDLLFAAGAIVAVVLVVATGFYHMGPREKQRAVQADTRRVEDLRWIAQQIGYRQTPRLPETLADLAPSRAARLKDPLTNAPYEYRPRSGTAYELCATFATDSAAGEGGLGQRPDFWSHPKGRHCYQLDASQARPY